MVEYIIDIISYIDENGYWLFLPFILFCIWELILNVIFKQCN